MLVAGSPTRFLRMISFGLANLVARKRTSFLCERVLYLAYTKARQRPRSGSLACSATCFNCSAYPRCNAAG